MAISMMFGDRDGREREIFGPEPIDEDNAATIRELKRLKPMLLSPDPGMAKTAEDVAEKLFKRREELRVYADRWNGLVDDAVRHRHTEMVEAIDALNDGCAA